MVRRALVTCALAMAMGACGGRGGVGAGPWAVPSEAKPTDDTTPTEATEPAAAFTEPFDGHRDPHEWCHDGAADVEGGDWSVFLWQQQCEIFIERWDTYVPVLAPRAVPEAANVSVTAARDTIRGYAADESMYGVFCRYTGGSSYYFGIGGNGTWALYETSPEPTEQVDLDTGEDGSLVHPANRHAAIGAGTNVVSLDCVGDDDGVMLVGYVNGQEVVDVTDTDDPLPNGSAGIRADAFNQGVQALFDDFSVTPVVG